MTSPSAEASGSGPSPASAGGSPGAGPPLSVSLIFSGATYLTDFLLLGLMIGAARLLGPDLYGIFAFGLAFASILTFLTNPGLDSLLVNYVARDRDGGPHTIGRVLAWKLLLASGILGVFLLVLYVAIDDSLARAVALVLTGSAVARSFNMTFRSVLHAHERFDLETAIVASDRVLLLGLGLAAVLITRDPLPLAIAFLIVRLVTLIWAAWLVQRRICRFRLDANLEFSLRFQREALPFGIAAMLYGVSTQVDTLLLGMLASSDAVGRFSAPMKIYEGLLAGALIVNFVIYPRMSKQFVMHPEEALKLYETSMRYLLMLGGFIVVSGTLFADAAVDRLFGPRYAGSGPVLALLLWGVALRFQIATTFTLFRARRTQVPILWLSAMGLGVRVLLNLALIPLYGPIAAAAAVLVSEALILLGAVYAAGKLGLRVTRPFRTLPAVALAAGSGVLVVLNPMSALSLGWRFLALAAIYLTVLLATQSIRVDEIKGMRHTSEGIRG